MSISWRQHIPSLMLVLACGFWGMGFSWAKNVGAALNSAAGLPDGNVMGPILGLAIRFSVAAVVWLVLVPNARRGWSWKTVRRGTLLGVVLAAGLIAQHLGLDRSSEAVTAFLTSLTIVIVPTLVAVIGRQVPSRVVLLAVGVAVAGIWLLTGATATGFGRGEWLGVVCALLFSAELLLINRVMPSDSPWRITVVMFATVGLICWCVVLPMENLRHLNLRAVASQTFVSDLTLLTLLTTVTAFGLMNVFQPAIEPTRAAIIYLMEPLFATAFAWIHNGRTITGEGIVGASLIIAANAIAEVKWSKLRYNSASPTSEPVDERCQT